GPPRPMPVQWSGHSTGADADTLRFDGAGRATVWLSPGEYHYRLAAGGSGTVAVEAYSDELLPHPMTIAPHNARAVAAAASRSAREWPWLFALCIAGLAGEWFARRRMRLR